MKTVVWAVLLVSTLLSDGVTATDLVSVNRFGNDSGNFGSESPRVTPDGRFVAFTSQAGDLVDGDFNNTSDVFVHDFQNNQTILVSENRFGSGTGRFGSRSPEITPDGRYVVFTSESDDLVTRDNNDTRDVFVRDLLTATTVLVSVNQSGAESGNAASDSPQITPTGRHVTFTSNAEDLVAIDGNFASDVFVRDLHARTTTLVSVSAVADRSGNDGSDSPYITNNGLSVVFASDASDLVPVDTNFSTDVFLRDLQAGTTTLISTSGLRTDSGNFDSTDPRVSDDGRFVVFTSRANDLVTPDSNSAEDVFLRDIRQQSTQLVSVRQNDFDSGNFGSRSAEISPDGRFVVFESDASNLVALDRNSFSDVFVRDVASGITRLVSENRFDGGSGNRASDAGQITPDGRVVVFESLASDLVESDSNGFTDVFVRDLERETTQLVSVNSAGVDSANLSSGGARITPDSKFVAFDSLASDIVSIDTNGNDDVFRVGRESFELSMDYAITGSWYTPDLNGQGFAFEVVPNLNFLVVYWFTFTPDGSRQMWLQGAGTIARNQASVPLFRPVGGRFDDPRPPIMAEWGDAVVRLRSETEGEIEFRSDLDGVFGRMDIRRITPDIVCKETTDPFSKTIDAGKIGSWRNSDTDGQGFFFEVISDSNQIVVYWFTYTVNGSRQMWLQGSGQIAGEIANVTLARPQGGSFNKPDVPDLPQWGEVTVRFLTSTSGTVHYRSDLDSVTGTVPVTRITPLVSCD